MQLDRDGAQHFAAAFTAAETAALAARFEHQGANARLGRDEALAVLIEPASALARRLLGAAARPVRALFFDKTPERNWALGWHQDRTIAVRHRGETPGFTAWTLKSGIAHVVPPFDYLERMLTLRIHLDPAGPDNAPLLVAPGSHRLGRVAEPDIPAAVERLGSRLCLAQAGDVWAYSTPILHASARSLKPARRRVLQLSYSADTLPNGLEWLGV